MRFVITGGGTGGHIFPALAVAEYLRAAGHEVTYVGNPTGMEHSLVPERGFAFEGIAFSGMPRKPGLALIKWLAQLYTAEQKSKTFLKNWKPDVVFGTGGYVAGPVLMAAQHLKIPTAVHEPDAHPGLVNRFSARKASLVTAAFAASRDKFRLGPTTVFEATGNPLRQQLGGIRKPEALETFKSSTGKTSWTLDKKTMLVFGGSQGARSINQGIIETLPALVNDYNLQVVQVTGQKLFEESKALLDEKCPGWQKMEDYCLLPFTHEMPCLMALSDLAVMRSGSLSLSEAYLAGLPTILVPYPHAAADHQTKNAQASVQAGASVMVSDSEFNAPGIHSALEQVLGSPETISTMSVAAKALAKPQATERIAQLLVSLGS